MSKCMERIKTNVLLNDITPDGSGNIRARTMNMNRIGTMGRILTYSGISRILISSYIKAAHVFLAIKIMIITLYIRASGSWTKIQSSNSWE